MNMPPVLKPPVTFDQDTRIYMWITQRCAQDDSGKVYMQRSLGHRRTGRPTRYVVVDKRDSSVPYGYTSFGLTARSDNEAIEKANKRLAKELGAYEEKETK